MPFRTGEEEETQFVEFFEPIISDIPAHAAFDQYGILSFFHLFRER